MKKQKRDRAARAFQRGYHMGVTGKPKDSCPHADSNTRQSWLSGWREGRVDNWEGFTGVSGIHKQTA